MSKIIWSYPKADRLYHSTTSKRFSGVIDEDYVKKYLQRQKDIKVVSLGIGTGRELKWLDKLRNVKEIIGVDYSSSMLKICREVSEKYSKEVVLIKDDLLSFKKFKNYLEDEELPIVYICLINTLGNFEEKHREKILRNVKNLMEEKDRLILCLYKIPERIKTKIKIPSILKVSHGEREKITLSIEYYFNEVLWSSLYERYHKIPRFTYQNESNDVAVYLGKKKVFISHRFSEGEIKKLCRITKLKIEKLIEGKFMWVVMLKI